MTKHQVVLNRSEDWIECSCGEEPNEFADTLDAAKWSIEQHIKQVEETKEWLAQQRATTFLKEVDND